MDVDKRTIVEYFEIFQSGNSTNSSSGATPLTASQLYAIQLTTKFTASASMVGSLLIILSYIFFPIFRSVNNRLVLYLSISDFFASFGLFLGRWTLQNGVGGFCYFQAVLLQQFVLSSTLWTVCIAINLFCLIYLRKSERQVARHEPFYHIAVWGLPIPMWIICLSISEPNLGTPFGDASLWCWITVKWSVLQIVFFYAPLWASFLFNLIIYTLTGYKIIKAFRRLKDMKTPEGKKLDRKRKIAYMRAVSGYLVAFFVTWVWGSINRIQNWADPLHPIFALFLLHAIFTPLQGFLDFIVYAWATMWKKYRNIKQNKKDTLSQQPTGNPSIASGTANIDSKDDRNNQLQNKTDTHQNGDVEKKSSGNEEEKSSGNEEEKSSCNEEEKSSQESDQQESGHKGSPSKRTLTDQGNLKIIKSTAQSLNPNPNPNLYPSPNPSPNDGRLHSHKTIEPAKIQIGY
jgi:hypothetical protein